MKKPLWKSRTAWFGVAVACLPLLAELQQMELPGYLPTVIGLVVILLRGITDQAVTLRPVPDDLADLLVKSLLVVLVCSLAACSTVYRTVEAGQQVDCKIKPSAPFYVRCNVDGEEVLDLSGPQQLPIVCEGGTNED